MERLTKILLFLLIPTLCFGATINRENIKPKADYKSDGNTFFMVNMTCAEENTVLANVKNNTFVRCNITNCILDESNTFEMSIYTPEQPEVIEVITYEDLEDRINQLETFITDNSLSVPAEVK
ncbi:MAG: hypothetical protein U9O94_01430 [Nanoarchaeota archaeon]|nr:hypothetical protein [Nanoarchaeota archaeon]